MRQQLMAMDQGQRSSYLEVQGSEQHDGYLQVESARAAGVGPQADRGSYIEVQAAGGSNRGSYLEVAGASTANRGSYLEVAGASTANRGSYIEVAGASRGSYIEVDAHAGEDETEDEHNQSVPLPVHSATEDEDDEDAQERDHLGSQLSMEGDAMFADWSAQPNARRGSVTAAPPRSYIDDDYEGVDFGRSPNGSELTVTSTPARSPRHSPETLPMPPPVTQPITQAAPEPQPQPAAPSRQTSGSGRVRPTVRPLTELRATPPPAVQPAPPAAGPARLTLTESTRNKEINARNHQKASNRRVDELGPLPPGWVMLRDNNGLEYFAK